MLRARLATAAVAIPLLLAIIFLAPPWAWGVVVTTIALLALVEYLGLAFPGRLGPRLVGGVSGVALVFAAVSGPMPVLPLVGVLAAVLPVSLCYVVLLREDLGQGLADVGIILIGVVYTGLLAPHFYWLHQLPEGPRWVTFVIAVGMAGDSAGYFVGHAIGRHKLIPHVSPGKTVEGALGIVAASLLCAAVAKLVLLPDRSLNELLLLAGAMAVVGQIGDLSESVMKRVFGAKESGHIFPGHGGVLDRIDSLLFPVTMLYYYLVNAGGHGVPPAC